MELARLQAPMGDPLPHHLIYSAQQQIEGGYLHFTEVKTETRNVQ
jgi:hypothetical protein